MKIILILIIYRVCKNEGNDKNIKQILRVMMTKTKIVK